MEPGLILCRSASVWMADAPEMPSGRSHKTWSAIVGQAPVSAWTSPASLNLSSIVTAAAGWRNLPNRVPVFAKPHEGSSIWNRSSARATRAVRSPGTAASYPATEAVPNCETRAFVDLHRDREENAPVSEALLAARSMTKAFAGVQALKGVSFDVRAGEVHALVGENGAGKSTLIRIMTGAETPDAGALVVGGRSMASLDPTSARALGIAAIYQQPSLFPDLTI